MDGRLCSQENCMLVRSVRKPARVSRVDKDAVVKIGADIGYGLAKAVSERQEVIFPSAMGRHRELKWQDEAQVARYPGDMLTDDDGRWFIGELAVKQLRAGELVKLRGRSGDEEGFANGFRLRLLKSALAKLLPGFKGDEVLNIQLATGLPVDHMGDKDLLQNSLMGQHRV